MTLDPSWTALKVFGTQYVKISRTEISWKWFRNVFHLIFHNQSIIKNILSCWLIDYCCTKYTIDDARFSCISNCWRKSIVVCQRRSYTGSPRRIECGDISYTRPQFYFGKWFIFLNFHAMIINSMLASLLRSNFDHPFVDLFLHDLSDWTTEILSIIKI